ncbi:hypothetical protein PG993_009985 [Apiospora rasikravindrae]|uniref:Uncharacterized protein n=1 Tax=Apiospora rasikravindrae TaxID=990691 RepID=A0ABR1SKW9_9PEZI
MPEHDVLRSILLTEIDFSRFLPETQENKAGNWKVGQRGSEDVNSYLRRSAYQFDMSYTDIAN